MVALAHRIVEIDGAHGEGGGQLVRTAVGLAGITGTPIAIASIRARREKPGLQPQHVAAIKAVAALCDADVAGLSVGSTRMEFTPHALSGGIHRFDVGTAGSVALVAQALLPVMISAGVASQVVLVGGTDVPLAPPVDYLCSVLLWLLQRMGARVEVRVRRRGYYPRGGGEIEVEVGPGTLRPLILGTCGTVTAVRGCAHVANLPASVAGRMHRGAVQRLRLGGIRTVEIEARVLGPGDAIGQGGAIVAYAETDATRFGAARVAERGVRAEDLGEAVGAELSADALSDAALDVHAADQILIYLALAGGGGFTVRTVSSHARTAMWLIEQFLPVRFTVEERGRLARVSVVPRHNHE